MELNPNNEELIEVITVKLRHWSSIDTAVKCYHSNCNNDDLHDAWCELGVVNICICDG